MPRTLDDLRDWVRQNLKLDLLAETQLFEAIEQVMARQRQMVEESKHDAIQALTEGFTAKLARLQTQLSEKDVTVSNVARYFEDVVADLTDKSHRDPKTKLLNFNWFMERVESYLAVEQRVRWCSVGVVDITSFKRYNDTFGHAVGDLIIERVARILSDQIRSDDFLAARTRRRGRRPARAVRRRRILFPHPAASRLRRGDRDCRAVPASGIGVRLGNRGRAPR